MRTALYIVLLVSSAVVTGDIVGENEEMGISIIPVSGFRNPPRDAGVLVAGVQKGGAAAAAGIRTGDVLTKFNNKVISSAKDLAEQLDDGDPDSINFTAELWSRGQTKTVSYSATGKDGNTRRNTFTFTGTGGAGIANIVIGADGGGLVQQPLVVTAVEAEPRAWLGVKIRGVDRTLARAFDVEQKGVLVDDVIVGSPAEKAGIKVGDIIRCIGETEVDTVNELMAQVRKRKIGDDVMVGALRAGQEETFTVTLTEAPKRQPGNAVADARVKNVKGPKALPGQRPGWKPGQTGRFRPWASHEDIANMREEMRQEFQVELRELRKEIEKLKQPVEEE